MAHTKLQCAAKKLLHRPSMARRGAFGSKKNFSGLPTFLKKENVAASKVSISWQPCTHLVSTGLRTKEVLGLIDLYIWQQTLNTAKEKITVPRRSNSKQLAGKLQQSLRCVQRFSVKHIVANPLVGNVTRFDSVKTWWLPELNFICLSCQVWNWTQAKFGAQAKFRAQPQAPKVSHTEVTQKPIIQAKLQLTKSVNYNQPCKSQRLHLQIHQLRALPSVNITSGS